MDAANGATTKATADVTSKVTPDDPAAAADGRSPGRGATVIGERAVEKIVAAAIDSVPGTVSAGSAINRMAGRAYPRVDVQIDARGGSVTVETDVAVSWPTPVRDIARIVRDTVAERVRATTGLTVARCDVRVAAIVGADGDRPWSRVTRDDVLGHELAPRLRTPAATPLGVLPVSAPRSEPAPRRRVR